ncbi:MAG TPA: hypothetical protein VN698_04545 [Bacteroidia bacterium]|nr:hypothetical protein [Bacteroidia bacterium]
MNKKILKTAGLAFIVGAILTGCETSAEKVAKAEINLNQANKDLNEAQEEYVADIENYRKETDEKIAKNEKSMAEFEARIANEKKEAKDDYNKKIIALQQKNTDLKKRMDDYKADGKDKWELFKTGFTRDMNEIKESLRDLTAQQDKNTK